MKKITKTALTNEKVERNFGLVHLCAKRFAGKGIEHDDIFQAGCVGLIKAFEKFDESRGLKFSTYAVPVILGEIRQLFRNNGQVKISRSIKDLSLKITRERENFTKKFGREPTVKELALSLKTGKEEIAEAMASSRTAVSINCESENNKHKLEIPVNFDDENISERLSVHAALKELEFKDRKLVYLRFFQLKTQSASAEILGTTQVQVSRREKVILGNLKSKLT